MEEVKQENKMGVMPEGKLLFNMSAPIIISMLIQALYNIVDSIFVGMYDPEKNYALAAVNLAFPIQSLMISFSVGTSVGVASYLSRSLGQKNYKDANLTAVNGIFLSVITCFVFAVFGWFFAPVYYRFQSAVPEIIEYGVVYVRIVTVCSIGIFLAVVLERLLQSTGRTIYNMYTQGIGAITNIVFDYLLIFGIGPFPRLGVAGAAAATVFGQVVSAILGLFFNIYKNKEINISIRGFRPSGRIIKQIYIVGLPSIVMQSVMSLLTMALNKILTLNPNELEITAGQNVLGAYYKLQSFIFMPVFGLNNAMVPIIAFNYGAKNKKRIMKTYCLALVAAFIYMFLGMLAFMLIPEQLLSLFSLSPLAVGIGKQALRIISVSFLFAAFSIISVSAFQALGNGVYSMLNSLSRQVIVILPSAYILFKTLGVYYIWYAFPLAEVVSVILCAVFITRIYNRKLKNL